MQQMSKPKKLYMYISDYLLAKVKQPSNGSPICGCTRVRPPVFYPVHTQASPTLRKEQLEIKAPLDVSLVVEI